MVLLVAYSIPTDGNKKWLWCQKRQSQEKDTESIIEKVIGIFFYGFLQIVKLKIKQSR